MTETDEKIAVPTARRGVSPIRWTCAMKATFLDHLAGTCHITASAAAIGVTPGAVHQLRRRDPSFAADWEEALEAGYVMLETRLLGHALAGHARADRIEAAGDPTEAIDVEQALRLLAERQRRRTGASSRGGARMRRATAAETDAAILRLLRAGRSRTDEA